MRLLRTPRPARRFGDAPPPLDDAVTPSPGVSPVGTPDGFPDAPSGAARWVAVAGIGHDAGTTTLVTLLSSAYAAHRRYRIVAVDAHPVGGALKSRFGTRGAATVGRVGAAFPELTSFTRLTPYLDRTDDGVWAVAGAAADAPEVAHAREAVAALSGFFAVGVLDCGPIGEPVADALLDSADAVLLVAPVTAEGVLATANALDRLAVRQPPGTRWHCAVALVSTVPHPGTDVGQAARLLSARGGRVVPVPYDAGLLAGRLSPRSVSDGVAGAIRRLSTDLLARAAQSGRPVR